MEIVAILIIRVKIISGKRAVKKKRMQIVHATSYFDFSYAMALEGDSKSVVVVKGVTIEKYKAMRSMH